MPVGLIARTANSVLFVIPWSRYWIIGTTDTPWDFDPAHPAATHSLNVGEHRAVHRENALDADAVGDLADRERLADTAAAARDADALEGLDPLLLTFLHADVDTQRVTSAERGNRAEPFFLGFDERMHMTLGAEEVAAAERGPQR